MEKARLAKAMKKQRKDKIRAGATSRLMTGKLINCKTPAYFEKSKFQLVCHNHDEPELLPSEYGELPAEFCRKDFNGFNTIGKGAFGRVCTARYRKTNLIFALKFAKTSLNSEHTFLSALQHNNIIRSFGLFETPYHYVQVMEYEPFKTLYEYFGGYGLEKTWDR